MANYDHSRFDKTRRQRNRLSARIRNWKTRLLRTAVVRYQLGLRGRRQHGRALPAGHPDCTFPFRRIYEVSYEEQCRRNQRDCQQRRDLKKDICDGR